MIGVIISNGIFNVILLYKKTQRGLKNLQALRKIDQSISGSLDLHGTLNLILEEVITHLEVDAAEALLLRKDTNTLVYSARHGFQTNALQHTQLNMGESHAGIAALERHIVYIDNLNQQETVFSLSNMER